MTTKIRTNNTDLGSDTGGIVIPKGTTAERTDSEGTIRYNTSTTLFEYYDGSGWVTLEPTPQVTSVVPTFVREYDSTGTTTFTITGTGFKPGVTAQLVSHTGSIISFDTLTRNSSTQLTATITNSNVIYQAEPFDIKVTSATGLTSTILDQISINNNLYFVTASGSLGTQRVGTFSAFVQAIDPESVSVGYEIAGGSLPPGFTLNSSTGQISGTITLETADTTYTFIVRAYDDASNVAEREFSITLQGPIAESFTTAGAGTFNVPVGVTSVDALIVAGGGGGATGNAGGGGAGGLIYKTGVPVTPGGTVTFQIGNTSGQIGVGNDTTLTYGSPAVTLTAKGGGAGGTSGHEGGQGGQQPGGSGGGSGGQGGAGGTATQPTQPGDSGSLGFGNPGGSGSTQGAGGGGAGQAGTNGGAWAPSPLSGGKGGDGRAYDLLTPGSPVYYAGGGGGGGGAQGGRPGAPGGLGGGGGGSGPYYDSGSPGSPGQPNTGGGGGGAVRGFTMQGMAGNSVPGSTGGSGIVIIKY